MEYKFKVFKFFFCCLPTVIKNSTLKGLRAGLLSYAATKVLYLAFQLHLSSKTVGHSIQNCAKEFQSNQSVLLRSDLYKHEINKLFSSCHIHVYTDRSVPREQLFLLYLHFIGTIRGVQI